MKTQKWLSLLLALAMVFTLAACGGGQTGTSSSGSQGSTQTPASASSDDGKVYEFTFASEDASTAPAATVLDAWAARVEEMSGGRMKINIY